MGASTDGSIATLRVGMIGAGGIARVHMEAWRALGVSVEVYSTDGGEALAAEYGITHVATLEDLLDRVDLVDIVTPSSTHRRVALAAINAGRHVICEKPLAATSADAIEITRAARRAGVQVYPAHVVRYFPEYEALKASIDTGVIGDPAVLRFTRAGEAPRADSWFFDEADGGGLVLDQMIHDLDQARWLAGEVGTVYAVQNPATVDGRVAPIVTAHVILTHVSGAISYVQGFWGPPGLTFRTSVDVAGSGGLLGYESPDDGAVRVDVPFAAAEGDYLPGTRHADDPYARELRDFAEALAGGPTPRVGLEDGILAVALAEAAQASIVSGRPVAFDADSVIAKLGEAAK